MNEVVVGVDPRELSVPALLWAADEATCRGLRLHLVCAVPPVHDHLAYDAVNHGAALRVRAGSALADADDLLRDLHPGLSPVTELVDGPPAAVLGERAARATLTVVGSRRLGRFAEVLAESSVVLPLTARADGPVAVVRSPEHAVHHPPTVVVGVDGSASCRAAVDFAADQASLRGAHLRAVWVWPRPLFEDDDLAEGHAGQRALAEVMAGAAERHPDVKISEEVLKGRPVQQLAVTAHEALALVVGRRGHGGFTGLGLGSTAHGLLHQADCPVIVVPRTGPPASAT
ncbi:universal stress protein [Streptomyces xanthii]|uniref:Universal stress protein n=1 Tax=Streptomyces xanthii TaxID=2768069 RepID=A0A7H1B0P9_9ACTN|nr:universal stress protein [Streptomyces xanthii]QNS02304.1 universal stress protein [Streptomyces xanthii]